jgi:hypothetical protein
MTVDHKVVYETVHHYRYSDSANQSDKSNNNLSHSVDHDFSSLHDVK